MNVSFYVVSLAILLTVFLFFVSLGGYIVAHLYSLLGDDQALEEGYGTLNPFQHVTAILIALFLLTQVYIRRGIPFNFDWRHGIKGILQRLLFLSGGPLCHLFFATVLLTGGVWLYGRELYALALHTPLSPSTNLVMVIKNIFTTRTGYQILLLLFLLYSIVINIFLCIMDFLINSFDFFFRSFIMEYAHDIKVVLLYFLLIIIVFSFYGSVFFNACWKIVSFPAVHWFHLL